MVLQSNKNRAGPVSVNVFAASCPSRTTMFSYTCRKSSSSGMLQIRTCSVCIHIMVRTARTQCSFPGKKPSAPGGLR